jgi:hypothetical protein
MYFLDYNKAEYMVQQGIKQHSSGVNRVSYTPEDLVNCLSINNGVQISCVAYFENQHFHPLNQKHHNSTYFNGRYIYIFIFPCMVYM